MIATTKESRGNVAAPAWHADFLAMLPAITEHARFALRDRRAEAREDLIHEVTTHCFAAYHRLVERGKADLAYPSVLVGFALRKIFSGRRVGGRVSIQDVMSQHAQRTCGITVERLDRFNDQEGTWQESLVEDKHAGPAETAAARIDFGAWLGSLTSRDRRIAEMLAIGEKTGEVATRFGLSAARVSQLRTRSRGAGSVCRARWSTLPPRRVAAVIRAGPPCCRVGFGLVHPLKRPFPHYFQRLFAQTFWRGKQCACDRFCWGQFFELGPPENPLDATDAVVHDAAG